MLAFEPGVFLFEDHYRKELIGGDVLEADHHAKPQGRAQVEGAAEKLPSGGLLGSIKFREWAVGAARTYWSIRAEIRVTEFFAPQCPIDQKAQGGPVGPLSD